MEQPQWLAFAWAEFGVRERTGADKAAQIIGYFSEAGHGEVHDDETPWCAAFAGAMLKRAGATGTGSLMARSYLAWGEVLSEPHIGAIAVLSRGEDVTAGHVGFYLGSDQHRVFLLGGNQGDSVSVAAFEGARVLGYRWPHDGASAQPDPSQPTTVDDVFAKALRHVLAMEGGFSDDPNDPGGPTNRGITLETLARWQGESVTALSRARLIANLKRIPDETVTAIYRVRYWQPALCGDFSAPLALMHFDAAVNHGVGGAIRLLQSAVGVDADGEIGPQTRNAISEIPLTHLLDAYADARRARYRALAHFWRFGRGWLRRVDATLALARSWAEADSVTAGHIQSSATAKGIAPMDEKISGATTTTATSAKATAAGSADAGKWWVQSKTMWGTLITAAATVVPIVGPLIGIQLPGDVIRQFGDQTVAVAQAVAGLIGTLLAIYGRLQAAEPLTRRSLNVRL